MEGIQIVGYKKSGKTFLARKLMTIWEEKGIFADYIKFSHHNFENTDTDTGKFLHENRNVIGICPDHTILIQKKQLKILEILSQCSASRILAEGGKNLGFLPRIVCLQPKLTEEELGILNNGMVLATFGFEENKLENIPHFTPEKLEELGEYIEDKLFLLAGLNCKACGFATCLEAGQSIVAHKSHKNICKALEPEHIQLKINGKSLPLNPFTALFMENTLKGMVSTLKGASCGKGEITWDFTPFKD